MASRVLNRQMIRPNFESGGLFHPCFEMPSEDLITKMAKERLSSILATVIYRRFANETHIPNVFSCAQFLLAGQNPSVSNFDLAWQSAPLTPEIEAHGYDQGLLDAMCTPIEFVPGVGFVEKGN